MHAYDQSHSNNRAWANPWTALVALVGYSVVIIALTMLKAFFVIGYLWVPERQCVRELHLTPLAKFSHSSTIFGPVFDVVGNLAFFIPFGVLAYVWLSARRSAPGGARHSALSGALSGSSNTRNQVQGRTIEDQRPARRTILLHATIISAGLSLSIEILQYICALGRTDIDDLLFNTLGGFLGAGIAAISGRRFQWLWLIGAYVLVGVFLVLVILGPRLGDPNAVVN